MQSQPSHKQYGAGVASTDGSILLDAPIIAWRDRIADPVEDDLAHAFYALLDDADLREVFGDLMVPARTELGVGH